LLIGTTRPRGGAAAVLPAMLRTLESSRVRVPDNFVLVLRVLVTIGGFMQLHGVTFNLAGLAGALRRAPSAVPEEMII
jgi:predicted unusual protein kinase regulating ubiquinone biosynthesis (AarF/ABC1/UbiB family)